MKSPMPSPAPTIARFEQVWFTEDEYLRLEEQSLEKNEFRPTGQILQNGVIETVGEIVAMAGASRRHNIIRMNISGELHAALKGRRCTPYGSDQQIKIPATGLQTYPDVSVICDAVERPDSLERVATNPTVLVEVLSKSTEDYDRGKKFLNYQQLESLKEYVLVSTDEARIERFQRQQNGTWSYEVVQGMDQTLRLESIEVSLALADVYYRVDFSKEEE